MNLKDYIRDVPDFPIEGILFRDITPLLSAPEAFRHAVNRFLDHYNWDNIDIVLGIESRGFLFAAPLAYRFEAPLIPVRKEGKLPFRTNKVSYSLEYGESSLEMHTDAVSAGHRVLLVDDILATGGTMAAAIRLVEQAGGEVAGVAVVVELSDLDARSQLRGHDVFSLVTY